MAKGVPHKRLDLVGIEPTPKCFHPKESGHTQKDCDRVFWYWNEAACDPGGEPGASSFCADCTPEYKAQEVEAGRCEFPNVFFQRDPYDPEGIIGVRPTWQKVPTGWKRVRFVAPEHTGELVARLNPARMVDGIKGASTEDEERG